MAWRFTLLLLVCVIARAGEPAETYSKQIEKLDRTRPESVCQARTLLRESLPKAGPVDRAAMFRAFRALYLDIVGRSQQGFVKAVAPVTGQMEQLKPIGLWNSSKDIALLSARPEIHRAIGPWLDCGFAIKPEVGMWFPVPSSVVMMEFVPKLPATLAAYIRFRAHEDAEMVAGDAELALTWRQLAERLLRWEEFGRLHAEMVEIDAEVEPEINNLWGMFLFGVDNTPTFIEGRIAPDLIAAWRWFVGRSPRSEFAPLINDILEVLERNSYKLTSKDRALFARFGLDGEFDRWLRNMEMRQQ